MTEAVLQRLILGQVQGDPRRFPPHRVWIWRANVVAANIDGERFVRAGLKGQADLSGIIVPYGYGEIIGLRLEIEVKGTHGKRKPHQITFGDRMTKMGAIYVIAYTLEDALHPIDCVLRGDEWRK